MRWRRKREEGKRGERKKIITSAEKITHETATKIVQMIFCLA